MGLAEQYLSEVWSIGSGDGADQAVTLTPAVLAQACRAVLPIDAAGITTTRHLIPIPIGASGEGADVVEKVQATLGEGPCLSAVAEGRPLACNPKTLATCWPIYTDQVFRATPYRFAAAIPLAAPGRPTLGALSLYAVEPDLDRRLDVARVKFEIGDLIAGILDGQLAGTGIEGHPGLDWLQTEAVRNRVMVWTAVGLVMAASSLREGEALSALRGFAYRHSLTLDELAEQLVFERQEVGALVDSPRTPYGP